MVLLSQVVEVRRREPQGDTMLEDVSAYDDPVLRGCEEDDDEGELLAFIIFVLFLLDAIERKT